MKKVVLGIIVSLSCALLVACSVSENAIQMPRNSDEYNNINYQDAVASLEEAGFTNVKAEAMGDLKVGLLNSDGAVEEITVHNPQETFSVFSTDTRVEPDAEIVISYHSFPAGSTEQSATEQEATANDDTSPSDASTAATKEADSPAITVDNSPEFAAALAAKDLSDPAITEFFTSHVGDTIRFDGNVADVAKREDYKTRFDFLLYAGDYSTTGAVGPNFKIEDASILDLHTDYDTVLSGINCTVEAKIADYDSNSECVVLDDVTLLKR